MIKNISKYKEGGIPEQKVVESLDGKVVYLPLVKGFSTTRLINEIKKKLENCSSP